MSTFIQQVVTAIYGSLPSSRTARLALLAGVVCAAPTFSAPGDGNADVILGTIISVDELPDGVSGGANEINHVPGPENDGFGTSQALTIDFGNLVFDVSAALGGFFTNDAGTGCTEVGRWTAFDASGLEIGTGTFEATSTDGVGAMSVGVEPPRFLVFSAEPLAPSDGCFPTAKATT